MSVVNKKHRLFFALWPTEVTRRAIVETFEQFSQQIDGQIIQPQNLHITLHFIGSVTHGIKVCMHDAAQTVVVEAFDIHLDCFGHFNKAKIFWMATKKIPAELTRLHQNLGEALSGCRYHSDLRPYSPHVSLLRKSREHCTGSPDFLINWHVDEFVLVESNPDADGVSYKIIERYPLQNGDQL